MPDYRYKIAVLADGDSPYIEDTFETIDQAVELFESMKTSTFVNDGDEEFVFDHKDDILVLDGDKALLAWNRDEPRDATSYDVSKFQYVERVKKVIGWQIIGPEGYNIHAEEDDPFGLNSFDILVDEAAATAREWVAENPGYSVREVFAGDIEEPEFVEEVSLPSNSDVATPPRP